MRHLLFALLFICLAPAAWTDGFTTYGVRSFNSINETDQVSVIRLEPKRVTLDMYIGIDGIPTGQTVTYVLPFWQQPQNFTMTAQQGDDFRKVVIAPLQPQFRHEIRRANRKAVATLIGPYLFGGCMAYAPLTPLGILGGILFPTFGKHNDNLSPYTSTSMPAGSAELYHVSTDHDLQALIAQAGLPAKYDAVLRKYHTAYYAIMRLHGQADTQGLHFHFTHHATGEAYTYTYPLGTGGAWSNPIVLTEVYVSCPSGYYLTPTAPTIGENVPYRSLQSRLHNLVTNEFEKQLLEPDSLQPATASVTPPVRYPTAWHRAYYMSNPTDDIIVKFARQPAVPLFTFASRWRDADWMPLPFIVLGFLLSVLISITTTVRNAWLSVGKLGKLWRHGGRFLRAVLTTAIPVCILLSTLLLDPSELGFGQDNALLVIIPLMAVIAIPFVAIFLWQKTLAKADGDLPLGTMREAAWMGILWYVLLLPVWLLIACEMDKIVSRG